MGRRKEAEKPEPKGGRDMAESSADPITPELKTAFERALDLYRSTWTPAVHGHLVPFDQKDCTICEVFALASRHDDPLPEDASDELFSWLHERHKTYATAADCLLKRITHRRVRSRLAAYSPNFRQRPEVRSHGCCSICLAKLL